MQTQTTSAEAPKPQPFQPLSCKTCAHINVCSPFRAIAQMLEAYKGEKPFQAESLAQICSQYLSGSLINGE